MPPSPTPKRELAARGSWLAKVRPDDLEFESSVPTPPDDLRAEARAEWDRVVPLLAGKGVLAEADRAALIQLCESWAEVRDLEAKRDAVDAKAGPDDFTNAQKTVRQSLHQAWLRWSKMAERFGLTPADRPRVKLNGTAKPKDGKGRFFQGEGTRPRLVG